MDELTGLPNRRTLLEYLDKAIQYSLENKKVGAVCFIDLDSFKIINDTMGHKVGDKILKESADRIKSVIGKDDVFGRLGGDEFLLIINSIDKVDSLFNISQKIIVQINRPFVIDGVKHYIGVSIGISLFPYDSKSKEEILQFADMAMYKAKELGKNRYHFFTFELNNSLKRKGLIEKVLRFALEHDGFYLEFQPQVDVSTGAVVGLESLIRIKSSIAKDISPKEFIKVAEESNLIFDIGKWSIQRSCQQLYIWKQFYTIKKITISINLSKRQLLDEELAYFVDKVLTQFNIEPNWIEFEITEALILNSNERIVRNLRRLKDIGCHISIDDFGTGYLSLNTFKDKIVDKIKIDKSVIDNLVNNRDDRDIIKASITMANMMGLTIVAEGVEKEEQKKILSILGCKEIQGYFYSKPLKAEEALPLVVLDKSLKKSFF
jgi:diguanylate cyclase (GGDEF)-like protein